MYVKKNHRNGALGRTDILNNITQHEDNGAGNTQHYVPMAALDGTHFILLCSSQEQGGFLTI